MGFEKLWDNILSYFQGQQHGKLYIPGKEFLKTSSLPHLSKVRGREGADVELGICPSLFPLHVPLAALKSPAFGSCPLQGVAQRRASPGCAEPAC